jgi:hypothetical protein
MAGIDWPGLIANIYGYSQQKKAGEEAYDSARERTEDTQGWATQFLANLRNTYANELAGVELPSETSYKQQAIDVAKTDLAQTAAETTQANLAQLSAIGALRGGGATYLAGKTIDTQLKALAKIRASLDAEIAAKISQRQQGAKATMASAEASTQQRVQQVQDQETLAKLQAQQAQRLTKEQFAGAALPLARFGIDYGAQVLQGQGFNARIAADKQFVAEKPEIHTLSDGSQLVGVSKDKDGNILYKVIASNDKTLAATEFETVTTQIPEVKNDWWNPFDNANIPAPAHTVTTKRKIGSSGGSKVGAVIIDSKGKKWKKVTAGDDTDKKNWEEVKK